MKRAGLLTGVLLACLLLTGSANSETRKMSWARRSLVIAACATSAYDGYQSAHYLDGQHHLYEKNKFLANPDGSIRTGRMIGLKAPFCAVPLIMGEIVRDDFKPALMIVAGASTGLFTFIDLHNLGVIRRQKLKYPDEFK